MRTVSINVMNLCVPCENRCRYCLLSYDGKTTGVDYKRSENYAKGFYMWLKENRPDLSFLFGFGYSMEHPNLLKAIEFCQNIGSATGDFLQFNGMKFRSNEDHRKLSENVRKRLNTNQFKMEREWLRGGFPVNEKRVLAVTLRPDNIDFFENRSFEDTIAYLEKLDEDYYAAIPAVEELAKIYGDPEGERYYSARDLYLHYQRRYIADNGMKLYDINDERQCFSRRF